jgi:hypothetical protein
MGLRSTDRKAAFERRNFKFKLKSILHYPKGLQTNFFKNWILNHDWPFLCILHVTLGKY